MIYLHSGGYCSYGVLELTVTSPPQSFSEPLTLAEVKKFLELPERSPVDSEEDAMLEGFIIAAREIAEGLQKRDLVEKQYDLSLDYLPYEAIELRRPLVSVDLMRYRDSDGSYTTMTADTQYIVDTARGLVMPPYSESWPSFTEWPSGSVLVRYTSGLSRTAPFWSDAGQRVLIGMKMLISHWFTGRLPFEPSNMPIQEYPWSVTQMLRFGAIPTVP